jgi:hypothetical protein
MIKRAYTKEGGHHPGEVPVMCPGCGQIRFYYQKDIDRRKTKFCKRCVRKAHRKGVLKAKEEGND